MGSSSASPRRRNGLPGKVRTVPTKGAADNRTLWHQQAQRWNELFGAALNEQRQQPVWTGPLTCAATCFVSFRQGCVEGRRPVGTDLGWSVLSWFDSNEQLVPLVVLARGGRPPAWKSLIQQLDVGDQVLLHPSPVWQSLATGAADLVGKKLDGTVVDPVIMWFNNALAVFVAKPNQTFLLDCSPK